MSPDIGQMSGDIANRKSTFLKCLPTFRQCPRKSAQCLPTFRGCRLIWRDVAQHLGNVWRHRANVRRHRESVVDISPMSSDIREYPRKSADISRHLENVRRHRADVGRHWESAVDFSPMSPDIPPTSAENLRCQPTERSISGYLGNISGHLGNVRGYWRRSGDIGSQDSDRIRREVSQMVRGIDLSARRVIVTAGMRRDPGISIGPLEPST
jgi:Uncharacterized protein conserved in bacteria, putative virulence factor